MDIKTQKSRGRPKLDRKDSSSIRVEFQNSEQRAIYYRLGDGNISKGIRKAADLLAAALKGVF
jgi:hypothetical protein